MKKLILIILCFGILSCSAQQNLTATAPNTGTNAAYDMYYRGADGLYHSIPIGKEGTILTVVKGVPTWAAITGLQGAQGIAGAIGPTGATGAQGIPGLSGLAGLPAANEGDVLSFHGNGWVNVPASFNVAEAEYKPLTGSQSLISQPITDDGEYTVSGTLSPITGGVGSTMYMAATYTDQTGTAQTVTFPTVTTLASSTYSPVEITCKGGTTITMQTVVVGTGTYNAAITIHRLR